MYLLKAVLLSFLISSPCASSEKFKMMQGKIIASETPLYTTSVMRPLHCAYACLRQQSCRAFSLKSDGTCYLSTIADACGWEKPSASFIDEAGGVYGFPSHKKCPQTCQQLNQMFPEEVPNKITIRYLPSLPVPVQCSPKHFYQGGFTRILTSSTPTWTLNTTLLRNESTPAANDYSILSLGDKLLTYGTSSNFTLFLIAFGEGRHWIGVWSVSRSASLINYTPSVFTTKINESNSLPVDNILPWIDERGDWAATPGLVVRLSPSTATEHRYGSITAGAPTEGATNNVWEADIPFKTDRLVMGIREE